MEEKEISLAPTVAGFPRMLLGVTLIFWGWMVDLPLIGLLLAFLFEGPHWLPLRWNFTEKAFVRAWSISVVAMVLTAFVLWMNGVEPETVREFVSWMPLFLLSVQFTQAYGFADTIPLNTFSYFSRKKMALDRELGMNPQSQRIPFTTVYFVITLLFSAAGSNAYEDFFFHRDSAVDGLVSVALHRGAIAAKKALDAGLATNDESCRHRAVGIFASASDFDGAWHGRGFFCLAKHSVAS